MRVTKIRKTALIRGFTLIELLVALIVSSVVLTAVSTLAFALSSANKSTNNISYNQAQIRFTTLRIQELFRNCKLICSSSSEDLGIWLSDNNNDNNININELVYIEFGSERDHLRLYTFSSEDNSVINIDSISAFSTNWWSLYSSNVESVMLLSECSNLNFHLDASPPNSHFVNFEFKMTDNNIIKQYQINAALRSWNGNLLDKSGSIISDDD